MACQGLSGCRYLSVAPCGSPYELAPSLENLSRAAGLLLGQPGWARLADLQSFWNGDGCSARPSGRPALELDEERTGRYRPMLSDESRLREVAKLQLYGARHSIELCLEAEPPIALVTHRSGVAPWAETTLGDHLREWASPPSVGDAEAESRRRVLHSLWPVVLGERMLDGLPAQPTRPHLAQAVLSCRWGGDTRRWVPMLECSTADQSHATSIEAARRRSNTRALHAVRALALGSATAPNEAGDELAIGLLPWLLRLVPDDVETASLASALGAAGRRLAWGEAHTEALSRRRDAELIEAVVGLSTGRISLAEACRGRSAREILMIVRCIITSS
jgi:hypothetical protein